MAQRDETAEDSSPCSPNQRRDSGYAPLAADGENEKIRALSRVKIRIAECVPEHAGWISLPQLHSWKDVQTRGKDAISTAPGNHSFQDRAFNTVFHPTASNLTVAKVSRFEDIFQQMRKEFQLKHRSAPNRTSFSVFGGWDRNKDSIDFSNQFVRSKPASASSDDTTWLALFRNPKSSETRLIASLEATPDAKKVCRKQDILQMPNWRSPYKTSQESEFRNISTITRIASGEETDSMCAQEIAAIVKARQAAIEETFGPGTLQSFRPSHRALRRHGLLPHYDVRRKYMSATESESPGTYRGDPSVGRNHSADIADEENCALWVLSLPAHVTYSALLNAIRGIGKIYAVVINPPTGSIRSSAAKIVFFKRCQAERLYELIEARRFIVMGHCVHKVAWNKIKTGPYPHLGHSRAIRITGSRELMDFDFFEDFFLQKFAYDLDRRVAVPCNRPGLVSHEWHFGSLRCQAASAKTAIEREFKGIFEVEWAVDPCEFP